MCVNLLLFTELCSVTRQNFAQILHNKINLRKNSLNVSNFVLLTQVVNSDVDLSLIKVAAAGPPPT